MSSFVTLCAIHSSSKISGLAAYFPPTKAPTDVPTMRSIGTQLVKHAQHAQRGQALGLHHHSAQLRCAAQGRRLSWVRVRSSLQALKCRSCWRGIRGDGRLNSRCIQLRQEQRMYMGRYMSFLYILDTSRGQRRKSRRRASAKVRIPAAMQGPRAASCIFWCSITTSGPWFA